MGSQSKKFQKRKLLINGLGVVGHVTRNNLERVGGLLDGLHAKSTKTSRFVAVDLDNFDAKSGDNPFSQQTIKTSGQLIGPRLATYGKFAKKVVPDSIFQKMIDSVFVQVAKLAAGWSVIDLPNQHRFAGIQSMGELERNALAKNVANQNRALATLGGVTGLAGLPGMLADTLWLLLVSLRTVYQLAMVYDKPLTGKQGVKMAYAVLSNADLSKMQEKQSILAGLGVVKGMLDKADHAGLQHELKRMGLSGTNVGFYAEQVDKIAQQFSLNVDNMDLRWLVKFIPVISVGMTAHYNHYLINEVIGVANATFGPEPKIAKEKLSDDSASTTTNHHATDNTAADIPSQNNKATDEANNG